jgi:glycyl-tRNA synthetase
MGTPRRLVIYVRELAPRQKDLEQVVKGPPAGRAFDALGQPTQAAIGFARSKGVEVSELAVKEIDGGSYIAAIVRQAGRPTPEVLAQALPGLIAGLRFDKAMRWNASNVSFSRPIRWLLALYGGQVVPFEYAGLRAGNTTRGLRFLQPERLAVADAVEYFRFLAGQGILLDPQARKEHIQVQVRALASQSGGQVVVDPALLAEVCNLVEAPTPLLGSFDPQHLELPQEVLISVMKKHQRCFPVSRPARPGQDSPGLLPHFIAVRNGDDQHLETVTEGNADVIRARFSDAAYFVRADQKRPLSEYLPRLASLTFQKDLGSMLDKSRRLEALVADLAPLVSLSDEELATARRAAALCKADLATQMVVDMTSLQGVMGRYYALRSGETPAAAQAIYEHYLPRFTGDNVPQGKPGLLVGLADRLDTLVGLFAVGLAPTGAKDPFALRRAALGLVQSLIAWGLNLDLREALRLAADRLPVRCDSDELTEALIFIVERLRNLLLEQGYRYDVVDAVLLAQGRNPASAAHAVGELSRWVARPDWHTILPA